MISMSRNAVRRTTTMITALGIALTAIVATPPSPAYAHSRSSAIYNGCGSGFHIANDGIRKVTAGDIWGEVILTYNANTGQNCVVTRKIKYHGEATLTGAHLLIEGETIWRNDNGYFSHWASVTASARGKCVKYWGTISNRKNPSQERYVTAEGKRNSWGNCG